MVQYIRKDTLVNEIEARIQKLLPMVGFATTLKGASMQAASEELKHILSFLNNLEVKEVKEADLEKMWKEYFKYRGDMATVNVKHLAKHFFELGLKAQKGE